MTDDFVLDRTENPPARKDTAWMTGANCLGVDADLMFPGRGEDVRDGKKVCAGCSVRDACLEYSMTPPVERYGIFGGLSERERRKLRVKARRWVA
ncbi:MAG TPA: WhiB family transcriptional regulator [Nocardioidaceae bacterium]|nr:WhiB family transcriptional regulator [Nocardioidaceae bacterium]